MIQAFKITVVHHNERKRHFSLYVHSLVSTWGGRAGGAWLSLSPLPSPGGSHCAGPSRGFTSLLFSHACKTGAGFQVKAGSSQACPKQWKFH